MLVRGPNVTPGYLGSGGGATEDGWFRTGDIGEIDERGRLRIRGRLKDVIVTPEGENVPPVDVEAAFAGIPGVREACVLGLPFAGGESVHAALLLDEGADPMEAVSRANEKLLPKQRVRGHTVWPAGDFPRTPTGKVRKGLLRDGILALQGGLQGEAAPEGVRVSTSSRSVRRLVAEVARIRPESLKETTRLVEGLGLGSLDLVELTVAMEEEFGVSLPEDRLAGATVGDLERLAHAGVSGTADAQAAGWRAPGPRPATAPAAAGAEEGIGARGSLRMPRWALRAPVHLLRRVLEEAVYVPFVRFYARPEVLGLERLAGAEPPFLLVANHRSYLDSGLFKTMLPGRLRGRIAPAMTTRYHRVFFGETEGGPVRYAKEWFQVRLVEFLFNAWPLPETAGLRASLFYAGELADAGFSLLIFPEGRHVPGDVMDPFRKGIGIFARELRLPVVPAYVEGTARVLPDGASWPRIGRTRLVFGPPLRIDESAEAGEATRLIEAAVRALQESGSPQKTGSSAGLPSSPGGGGGGT
ncbi:MAG: AMP-binding protein [Acidobacteria bacterium]|nr:AMP-binding protein [Acidobacteriota bacterium]